MAKFKHISTNRHHRSLRYGDNPRTRGNKRRRSSVARALPLTECDPHPERVVLLGQVGEDVGVEHSSLQEAAPQSGQLGAELAHVPADLLRHLLVAFLQLMEGSEKKRYSCNIKLNTLDLPKYILHHSIIRSLVFPGNVFIPADNVESAACPTFMFLKLIKSSVNQLTLFSV